MVAAVCDRFWIALCLGSGHIFANNLIQERYGASRAFLATTILGTYSFGCKKQAFHLMTP
jgi:hypothetical protein